MSPEETMFYNFYPKTQEQKDLEEMNEQERLAGIETEKRETNFENTGRMDDLSSDLDDWLFHSTGRIIQ